MKDRILQIMKMENMSQQDFARALEVSPATLSNIFNGKTNPTNNHVTAIHHKFPNIRTEWVMFGEGPMCKNEVDNENPSPSPLQDVPYINKVDKESTIFDRPSLPDSNDAVYSVRAEGNANNEPHEAAVSVVREVVKYIDKPQRKITEIRVFFDDGTYEVFNR